MVIPWNPVFLNNLQLISQIISDFDPKKILFTNNIFGITDIGQLMNFSFSQNLIPEDTKNIDLPKELDNEFP